MAITATSDATHLLPTTAGLPPLRLTHFHVGVRDLDAALAWFERVCTTPASFRKGAMAYLTLGQATLVLEEATSDTITTIAFASTDCDADYATLVARGATPRAAPDSKPWGIRGAYLQGPAGITFELEQRL